MSCYSYTICLFIFYEEMKQIPFTILPNTAKYLHRWKQIVRVMCCGVKDRKWWVAITRMQLFARFAWCEWLMFVLFHWRWVDFVVADVGVGPQWYGNADDWLADGGGQTTMMSTRAREVGRLVHRHRPWYRRRFPRDCSADHMYRAPAARIFFSPSLVVHGRNG